MKTARDLVSRRREMSDRENDPSPGGPWLHRTGEVVPVSGGSGARLVMDLMAGG
jgi:hypothetical protein